MLNGFLFARHLEENETITRIVHRHWLIGCKSLFWPTLSFLLSFFVLAASPRKPVFILVSLWSGASVVWWVRNFLDYYLDAWLVTNHGVIALEWFGWFHRKATRILYSDIEGVSYETQGVFATLMRYGTLSLEKISTGSKIAISHVLHARRIEADILKNMEAYLTAKNLKDSAHVRDILAAIVAERSQLENLPKKAPAPKKKAWTPTPL